MSYLNGSPNGKLYVGAVKWSNDYTHVMLFSGKTARNTFMTNHLSIISNQITFINPNGYIDVEGEIVDVENLNYCYYTNDSDISNTPYCCFITNFEYIAPKTTRLFIELDVFQMYHYDTSYYQSFIERAIVSKSENTNNKNYLPEPISAKLEYESELTTIGNENSWQPIWVLHSASYYNSATGEYDYKGIGTHNTYGEYGRFIESQSEIQTLLKMYGRQSIPDTLAKIDKNLQEATTSGLNKSFWRGIITTWLSGGISTAQGYTDLQGISALTDGLSIAQFQDHRDELIGLYAIPKWLKDEYIAEGGDNNYADNRRVTKEYDLTTNVNSLANGYKPRNKKLLTSVCRAYVLANRTGLKVPFKPELFTTDNVKINLYGITMSTGGYQYSIPGYNDRQLAHGECDYSSERRVGYDANTGLNKVINGINAGAGVIGAVSGAVGGAMTGNAASVIGSGANITNALVSAIDQIGQKEGRIGSNGDLLRVTGGRAVLRWFEVNPSVSECQAIDNFFDMYGYTIHKHQNPTSYINTRTYWNYVKTSNINLSCNAPANYENKLKSIYNNGVTLWHSYNNFGDYSQNNLS